MNKIAIVIPLRQTLDLSEDEKISLRHLDYYLKKYDKFFIISNSFSEAEKLQYQSIRFDDKYFGDNKRHSKLLLSECFYSEFKNYDYILIYHTDSLVFSDELIYWSSKGYDYIGALWVKCSDTPWVRKNEQERAGNGGFSLRNVKNFLKVLDIAHKEVEQWPQIFKGSYNKDLFNTGNEDLFWSYQAVHYLQSFRVASFNEGLKFAFEAAPEICYNRNQKQIPFGCHAWNRYNRKFWEPYLLKY